MNDKSMAAAAVRENGAPSICVFDVNGTLLDIEYIAPVFQRLFGDFECASRVVRAACPLLERDNPLRPLRTLFSTWVRAS